MNDITDAFLFQVRDARAASQHVFHHNGSATLLAWVSSEDEAVVAARDAADRGAGLVELYRGFDLASVAAVIEAVGDRIPVGVAVYAHGAAPAGPIDTSVTIYEDPAADPHLDRAVQQHADGSRTVVVGAAGPVAAAAVAEELVADGATLIEICGGTPLRTASHVQRALDGTAALSVVTWPFDSIEAAAAYKASFEHDNA